jgi:hypothetical protein
MNIIEFPFVQSHRSEAFLRQKYIIEGLSPLEIGAICFSSKRTVLNWLEQFRIPLRKEDFPLRRPLLYGEKRIRGKVIEDERQLRALKTMRELRAKGYSYPQITEILNSMNVPTQTGRGRWHLRTVHSVLNRAASVYEQEMVEVMPVNSNSTNPLQLRVYSHIPIYKPAAKLL